MVTPGTESGPGAKRSRVFIDPLTEIPRLERWFADDTHPSSYVIEKYTDELNRSPYRQRFPRLEPKNLQLWFKNHRAKMKRQRDACLAAAAAAAAAAASTHGGRSRDDDGKTASFYRQTAVEAAPSASGGVGAADVSERSNVDGGGTNANGGSGAAFQTGRTFDDRHCYFEQPLPASGGSALDELVSRLRSGPLGRLPESSSPLQPTTAAPRD